MPVCFSRYKSDQGKKLPPSLYYLKLILFYTQNIFNQLCSFCLSWVVSTFHYEKKRLKLVSSLLTGKLLSNIKV